MLARMSKNSSSRVVVWWFVLLVAALLTLLVAWAARLIRVPTNTLLTVAVVVVALSWLLILVTVPWNLYAWSDQNRPRLARLASLHRAHRVAATSGQPAHCSGLPRAARRDAVPAHP